MGPRAEPPPQRRHRDRQRRADDFVAQIGVVSSSMMVHASGATVFTGSQGWWRVSGTAQRKHCLRRRVGNLRRHPCWDHAVRAAAGRRTRHGQRASRSRQRRHAHAPVAAPASRPRSSGCTETVPRAGGDLGAQILQRPYGARRWSAEWRDRVHGLGGRGEVRNGQKHDAQQRRLQSAPCTAS